MPDRSDNQLRLGKGSAFVISRLKYLRQEPDTWEADFFPMPCSESEHDRVRWGIALSYAHDYFLALRTVEELPSVNDLARLLADAVQQSLAEGMHRPPTPSLRARLEWAELLPHWKQIGLLVESPDGLIPFYRDGHQQGQTEQNVP